MIVTCENCSTAFHLDDHLIKKSGTRLRCSSCKHVFTAHATPPPPEPVSPAAVPESRPVIKTDTEEKKMMAGDDGTTTIVDFSEEVFESVEQLSPQYVDMGLIGEGGMGEVKLARDTQLLRKVAIKSLKKDALSPATLSYFLREAQITAQLDHPNIVPLYTVKQPENNEQTVSFVMKLVKGQTLGDIIQKARNSYKENPKAELPPDLDLNARLGYFLKACDGMIYAHRKEVIHRDLKPSNIMIGDFGEVYVMDWGIAKMVREIPETLFGIQKVAARRRDIYLGGTEVGSVVGTPGYISPEQVQGLPDVGPPSDLFSLGVILYELTTLKPGRPGAMDKKLEWAQTGSINKMVHMLPDRKIDAELQAIIRKATASDPRERYPSVSALAEEVRRYLRGDEVSVLPDTLPRKMWRWMNKHRALTAILVLSVLLISSTITIGTLIRERANMKAAQIREKKLTHLLTKVARQGHYIDTRFIRLEEILAALASDAMYLIENAPPNQEPIYWLSDYQDPLTAPSDLAMSPLYGQAVSIDAPVVKLAPGVERADVVPLMQRLAPLRYHFRKSILDSRSSYAPLTEEEVRRLLTIHGLPVSWIFIGLEAGIMYSYPGKGRYPEDYDPRLRPWYRLGAHKNAVYWGNPYIDVQGLGMVLPCATSLYDSEGRFYGVAGMDVTYGNIIRDNLTRRGAIGVVESFLLDDKGRIIVRSSQLGTELEQVAGDSALQLELFPVPEVVRMIRRSESGMVEIVREEEPRIVFFHEVPSLNWYYAEEIKTAAVLGPDPGK